MLFKKIMISSMLVAASSVVQAGGHGKCGEVSVGADDLNAVSTWEDRDVETGVRLKSAFKF